MPNHIIHRHGMTPSVALEVESAMIDYLWDDLDNQKRGERSDYGPATVEQLQERYGLAEWERQTNHRLLLIKVDQRTVDGRQGSVYEATRASWVVSPVNASARDFVLGVVNGICKGIFCNCEWYKWPDDRYGFNGDEITDGIVFERYYNKHIPKKFRTRGMANPVLYDG